MKIAVMILTGLLLTGCAANLPDPAPQVYYRR
jgi:hypothetical protein